VAIFRTVDHDRAEMKPAELHPQTPISKICVSTNQTDIQISEIAPRPQPSGRKQFLRSRRLWLGTPVSSPRTNSRSTYDAGLVAQAD
jgi:hypothetical protein